MPQHHPNHPDLVPVPIAVLLPPTASRHPAVTSPDDTGLTIQNAGLLVATYTRAGDRIIDHDTSAVLAHAARALDRHITTGSHANPTPVALIYARLPRPDCSGLSLPGLTEWMRRQRDALTPGGFLLTTVSADRRDGGYLDRATTVITAARAAGLIYHQHLIAVHTPLPEAEASGTATGCLGSRLPGDRHVRVHSDMFAFRAALEGQDV